MHENARRQLGLTSSPTVNGGPRTNGHHAGAAPTPEGSRAGDLVGTALIQAGGWVARRNARRAPAPAAADTGAWLVRAAFGLFSAVVLASFVVIAIGLMSLAEATTLLMPVAVIASMALGLFLGDRRG